MPRCIDCSVVFSVALRRQFTWRGSMVDAHSDKCASERVLQPAGKKRLEGFGFWFTKHPWSFVLNETWIFQTFTISRCIIVFCCAIRQILSFRERQDDVRIRGSRMPRVALLAPTSSQFSYYSLRRPFALGLPLSLCRVRMCKTLTKLRPHCEIRHLHRQEVPPSASRSRHCCCCGLSTACWGFFFLRSACQYRIVVCAVLQNPLILLRAAWLGRLLSLGLHLLSCTRLLDMFQEKPGLSSLYCATR